MHIRFSEILSKRHWNIRKGRRVNIRSPCTLFKAGEQIRALYYLTRKNRKWQITSTKLQINSNIQISNKIKRQLFGNLNFGHCDLIGIGNLLFEIFIAETRTLTPETYISLQHVVRKMPLMALFCGFLFVFLLLFL
jgi:hypothetical protein